MKKPLMNNSGISSLAISIIVVIFAAAIVAFFVLRAEKKETIKIGAIISLSGPASHHVDIRDAMLLAVKEINTWGGVNGRKIELIVEDSKTDPEEGKKAFKRIEGKYHPLFYVSTTSMVSMALAPLAEQNKVVLIGVVVATPRLTEKYDWAFKYHTSTENEVNPILHILKKQKVRKLGILYQKDAFGTPIFNMLKEEFEKTGGKVKAEPFDLRQPDFKTGVSKLLDTEAIYTVGFVRNEGNALRQLQADNYRGIKLGHSGAASLPRPAPELNGVFLAAPALYNPNFPFARDVKQKYENMYGKLLTHQAANGYDVIKLLADLMEDREVTRERMKILLEEGFVYPGIFGDIQVKPGDHDMNFPLYPARIVGKDIEFLQ